MYMSALCMLLHRKLLLIMNCTLSLLGIVEKVYPLKSSPRYGKLCKLVLREDLESTTRHMQAAIINVFLLGEVADEGHQICEGDRVVLSQVIAECSPTEEHHFQIVVWREKSPASIWVINDKGKVRANMVDGVTILPISCESEERLNTPETCNDYSDEEGCVLYESCEYNFSQQAADKVQPKVCGKRQGKFQLGPRGVTPSNVKRSASNLVVLLDKNEVKQSGKTLQQGESSKDASTCTNVSTATESVDIGAGSPVFNSMGPSIAVEAGTQSMIMSQRPAPGGNGQSLSLCIQSANPTAEQPSNMQCTHIELTPSGVSTRVWNDQSCFQSGQATEPSRFGAMMKDLPSLAARGSQGDSQSIVVDSKPGEDIGPTQGK